MAKAKRIKRRPGLASDALVKAFKASGKTVYRVAKDAGIKPEMLARFLSGERDLRLSSAEKVFEALGLELRAKAD